MSRSITGTAASSSSKCCSPTTLWPGPCPTGGWPVPRTVRTLLGEKTLAVSLACLPTLVRYSVDPVRLVIHEDGTLSPAGRGALRDALPGAEFVTREEADARVDPLLAKHPRCREARAGSPLFLKLFDIALLETDELAYCDSDVLFLRPFTGVFGAADSRFRSCFMADVKHAYAVRPWYLWPLGRLRLAGRVNTGLVRAARGVFDLDLTEWVLGRLADRPVWSRRWYWAEQTCWAVLAGRAACGLWDRRRVILASPDMGEYSPDTVAVHFVSTYRHHLAAFADRGTPAAEGPPVAVGLKGAGRAGPVGQFVSDLRARMM